MNFNWYFYQLKCTFLVNLCRTNCTSPNAPLPMTLIKLKSSVFIRHCPISEETLASRKRYLMYLTSSFHNHCTYICWRRHLCFWFSWWLDGRSPRPWPALRPANSPHWWWICCLGSSPPTSSDDPSDPDPPDCSCSWWMILFHCIIVDYSFFIILLSHHRLHWPGTDAMMNYFI